MPSRPLNNPTSLSGANGRCRSAIIGRGGEARIHHDDPGPAGARAAEQPLIQHRMTPRGIAAHQDEEVRLIPILIDARDEVLAERPHVAGDREDMQSRELVSMLPLPMQPFISLLAT